MRPFRTSLASRPLSNHEANMTSRAARCFCEKLTGMPVLDSSSRNGPNEGLHASPWHYQKHYRRQVASPTCQDAGVFFSKRAGRERHGGHLLVAHVVSLDKSTRCQNSQASCPLSRSKSWPGKQGLVIFQQQNHCCFPACACLACAPFAGLFRGQVACTIPRLRSSQAKEADVPLVSREEGNAPLPAAVG